MEANDFFEMFRKQQAEALQKLIQEDLSKEIEIKDWMDLIQNNLEELRYHQKETQLQIAEVAVMVAKIMGNKL